MPIKDTDRKARKNYQKKVVRIGIDLYPTDEDIKQRFEAINEPKTTYIKRLIREDIAEHEDG